MMSQLPLAQPALPEHREGQVDAAASALAALRAKKHVIHPAIIDHGLVLAAICGLTSMALLSNCLAIMEVCCQGVLFGNRPFSTPLQMLQLDRNYLIGLYAATSLLSIISGIALTRYDLPKWMWIFLVLPWVFAAVAIGVVLRKSGAVAKSIACFYLVAGSMLTGLGAMYFVKTGMALSQFEWMPIVYSLCLQSGLILTVASALSLDN